MALSEIFFLAIVLYLLYRFVFNFLVPVIRTTRHVKQQFRNMHEGANGNHDGYSNAGYGSTSQQQPRHEQKPKQPPAGDYIDFEEVK